MSTINSDFGIGQYFPKIGETISNSDLNTSHYLYIVSRCWGNISRRSLTSRNISSTFGKQFPIMTNDANNYLLCYTSQNYNNTKQVNTVTPFGYSCG